MSKKTAATKPYPKTQALLQEIYDAALEGPASEQATTIMLKCEDIAIILGVDLSVI